MFSNFGLLAKRSLSGIAWVYILYAILSFVIVTLPQSLVNALRADAMISNDPLLPLGLVTVLGFVTTIVAIVAGSSSARCRRGWHALYASPSSLPATSAALAVF